MTPFKEIKQQQARYRKKKLTIEFGLVTLASIVYLYSWHTSDLLSPLTFIPLIYGLFRGFPLLIRPVWVDFFLQKRYLLSILGGFSVAVCLFVSILSTVILASHFLGGLNAPEGPKEPDFMYWIMVDAHFLFVPCLYGIWIAIYFYTKPVPTPPDNFEIHKAAPTLKEAYFVTYPGEIVHTWLSPGNLFTRTVYGYAEGVLPVEGAGEKEVLIFFKATMNIRKARQEGLRSLSEEDLAEKLEKTIICKLKAKASDSPIQAPEGTLEMWEDPEQHAQKQDDQDPSPVDSKATDTQELRICGFPVLWSRKHTTIFRCPRNA